MIASCPAMRDVVARLPAIARARKTTLICGPTGSGKEVVARSLHEHAGNQNAPYVAVHCAALPESLIEAELFGHTRGAFTGATAPRAGLVRSACGGTLFLDEVDSLPVSVQTKLLRFLEAGEYRAVGSDRVEQAHAWVIAATNRSLEQQVEMGLFRADLFYRLDVLRIELPPLRLRGCDLELLAHSFLPAVDPPYRFTPEALAALRAHSWPGNVRELKHRVERAALLCPTRDIGAELLGLLAEASAEQASVASNACNGLADQLWAMVEREGLTLGEAIARCERTLIQAALRVESNNRSRAALRLKIHVRTLFKKLRCP